jgi:hypothetical protein
MRVRVRVRGVEGEGEGKGEGRRGYQVCIMVMGFKPSFFNMEISTS